MKANGSLLKESSVRRKDGQQSAAPLSFACLFFAFGLAGKGLRTWPLATTCQPVRVPNAGDAS
jgi:hypothetical protein